MEENNLLPELGSLGEPVVQKEEPTVSTESLLRITPTELTNPFASETERITYQKASNEYGQGVESAPDFLDNDGVIRNVRSNKETALINPYIEQLSQFGSSEEMDDDAVDTIVTDGGLAAEERAYIAEKNAPVVAREKRIMENYSAYQAGRLTYEEFLLKTYGNDVLKAQGYHTDSIAWWKSQFREGNYQHPLDNEYLKAGVVEQAESLFALESFYGKMLKPSKSLENLVGKTLEGEDYQRVFGDNWEKAVEQLGSYERAITYFKGGYLGDALTQLIYSQYDNNGNPVGDPAYYMSTDGKLYELVDRSTTDKIDKSRQMFLYKNADGSVDRVSTARNEFQEFGGSFVNGMAGAFLGIVDLVAMVGMDIGTAFEEDNFWDGASKVFLPLINKLWNKDDKAFTDAYASYTAVTNDWKTPTLKVQSFDTEKWDSDNVMRAVGSGLGFIVETGIEIAIGVATAGAGTAALTAAKGAKATGTSVIKGALGGLKTTVTANLGRIVVGKTLKEGGEVLVKELSQEVAEKGMSETVEKAMQTLTTDGVRELLEVSGVSLVGMADDAIETQGRTLVRSMIESTVKEFNTADAVVNIAAKEVQDGIVSGFARKGAEIKTTNGIVKSFGRFVKEGTKWTLNKGVRLSNTLRSLNSGSTPLFSRAATRRVSKMFGSQLVGRKWGTTVARATLGSIITIGETAANQRTLQQVRPEIEDGKIIENSLVAGLVTFGSTMLLSSSTDDRDNVARLSRELSEEKTELLRIRNKLGGEAYNKANVVAELANTVRFQQAEAAKKVLDAFDKFDIGKHLRGQTALRVVGGFSELLDNVLTGSVRNAANMGVDSIWGTVFSTDGILNPEIIIPAALSTGVSVVGRKGIFGIGDNEGSMMKGAAASKATVQKMYTDLLNIVGILQKNAAGTADEMNIIQLKTQLEADFAQAWKNNNGDKALASIEVLENVSKGLGADPNNPLKSLDDLVGRLKTTEAFQTALKNAEFSHIEGFTNKKGTKLNQNFSFTKYIGDWYNKDNAKSVLAYERAIITEYETRRKIRAEAFALAGTDSTNKIASHIKQIAKNYLNPIVAMQNSAMKITGKIAAKNDNSYAMATLFANIAGDYGSKAMGIDSAKVGVDASTTHLFNLLSASMGSFISENESRLTANAMYTRYEKRFGDSTVITGIDDYLINEKKFVLDTQQALKDNNFAKDDLEAARLLSLVYRNSKVKYEELDENEKGAYDFIKDRIEAQSEANRKFAVDHGLTESQLEIVLANAKGNQELAKKHLENGAIVTFATRKDLDLANASPLGSEEREYIEAVRRGVKLLSKMNQADGDSEPLDFVILSDGSDDEGGIKVFIASPKPINEVTTILKGPEKLKKVILLGGLISNPKTNIQDVVEYTKALFSVTKYTDQVFYNVEQIVNKGLSDADPVDYVAFLNKLAAEELIDKTVLAKLVVEMSKTDDEFELKVLNEMKKGAATSGMTNTLVRVLDALITVNKISKSLTADSILPPTTASELAYAATIIKQNVYDNKENTYMLEAFDIKDANIKSIGETLDTLINLKSKNFKLAQSELEKVQKAFSIQSTIYLEGEEDRRASLIKKIRTLKSLGLNDKFNKALDEIEKSFNEDASRIDAIDKVLSDLVEFKNIIESEEASTQFNKVLAEVFAKGGLRYDLGDGKGVKDIQFLTEGLIKKLASKEMGRLNKLAKSQALTQEEVDLLKLYSQTYEIADGKNKDRLSINEMLAKHPGIEALLFSEDVTAELKKEILSRDLLDAHKSFKAYKKYYAKELLGPYEDSIMGDPEVSAYIASIEGQKGVPLKSKIKDFNELLRLKYEEAKIYDKLELTIFEAVEARNQLYKNKGVVPFAPNVNKVTVNIGEVVAKSYQKFEKEMLARGINVDNEFRLEDVISMARGSGDIIGSVTAMSRLYHRYGSRPVLQFDLTLETDKRDFETLLRTLGYSVEDFNEASESKVLRIPGMYFNNDNAGIKVEKGKFKNLGDLVNREINSLVLKEFNTTQSQAIYDRAMVRNMFPQGIIGLSDKSPIRLGNNKVAFNMTTDDLFDLVIGYNALSFGSEHKSGKLARGSASYYTQQMGTITANGEEPVEFQNLMLIRSIVDGMSKVKMTEVKNEIAKIFRVPKDADLEALRSFGWEIDEKNPEFITGFNKETNALFLKNSDGNIDLFKVLPITKAGDNDFVRFDPKAGGGTAHSFESLFITELNDIFGGENIDSRTTNGTFKILPNSVESTLAIPKEITTFGEAIKYFSQDQFKNNITAISFVFALKSSIKASEAFDTYLTNRYSKEEIEKIKTLGILVESPEILKALVGNDGLTEEEILDNVKKTIKSVREKAKRKADAIAANSNNQATVEATSEKIYIGESFTYDLGDNLPDPKLIELEDIALLRRFAAQTFFEDGQELVSTNEMDLKNRFLSLLSEDDEGNIALPVANISRITIDDLETEIVHNNRKLKLGGYIKETFGDEFYNNLYQGIQLYDKTFMINRSLKLKTNEIVMTRYQTDQAGVRENYFGGSLNKENAIKEGTNAYANKSNLARRRVADEELDNLSTVTSKDGAELSELMDYGIKNIDNETINPFQSTASTRVANLNNRLVAANVIDNIVSVKDMLLNDKLKVGEDDIPVKFTEEKAEELANQIVTLSTTSISKAKTSFILLEVDEAGDSKAKLVMSSEEDPYSGLVGELLKREQNNSKYYLMSVESGFSLKTTDQDNVAFKMVDITGFNVKTNPEEAPFGRKLFLQMVVETLSSNKDLSDAKTLDEYNKAVSLQLMNYRMDQETEFIKERLSERFKDNTEVLKPMLALFKNTAFEVSASSSRRGFKDQIFYNTVYSNNSLLRQKETNASVLRRQGVIFDNLDREKKDMILESIIDKAGIEFNKEFNLESKAHRETVLSIVEDLLVGRSPRINDLKFNNENDRKVFADVLKIFATKTDNTAFKKFVLENIGSDGEVDFKKVMSRRTSGNLANKTIIINEENGQGFELRNVQDPTTSKFSFDGEWVFSDKEEGKRLHWQLGYSFIDEDGESRKRLIDVKLPDEVLKQIIRAKENPSEHSEYKSFVKFLEKDGNYETFIKAQKKAVDYEDAMETMKEDILSALNNNKMEQLVFVSHNGKGKGSDVETMRETFGEHFTEIDQLMKGIATGEFVIAGKTILGHLDLYNDVLNTTFLDASESTNSEENKRSLQSLGRKYISRDYVEKHLASDDAEDLLKILDAIYETGNVKEIAETKVIDYVEEIYRLLGGSKGKLDETLINEVNNKLKFSAGLDDDEKARLSKWRQDLEDVSEEMKKAVFDGLNEVQRKIEVVGARLEIEAAVRKLTPYDFDRLKNFFDSMPKDAGYKVKNAVDKIYTITSGLNLYSEAFEEVFTDKLINALTKIHPSYVNFENSNNKMATNYYSDDTFMAFAKNIVEGGDEHIDKIVKRMVIDSGKDIDPSIVTKSANLSETKNGFAIAEEEVDITDFAANSIVSKMQKKIVPLVNELIFDTLKDGPTGDADLVTALGEQLFTIFGAESSDDADQIKVFQDNAKTMYIGDSSLVSQLRNLLNDGFKGLSLDGLYRTAVAINPGMKERLGLESTTGKIITNDLGAEQLLGMSLEEYKTLHNLQGSKVFVSIFRQPGDRMNPIHAYELLVDNSPENGKNSFFAISAHEIISKHGGDFDGDKINIIVPDEAMQYAYNRSGYLEHINKPYVAMEKFIDELYDIVGLDYIRKDTMHFLKMQKVVAGVLKSNTTYFAKPIFEGIMNSDLKETLTIKKLIGNENTYQKMVNDVKASSKKYGIDLSEMDPEKIDQEILNAIVAKESRGYILHNRNLADADGNIFKGFLSFLNETAIKEFPTKILFASELRYRDSVTGETQKALLKQNKILDKDAYVTLKFDGEIYKMLDQIKNDESKRAKVIQAIRNTGIDDSIIDAFIKADQELDGQNIYNVFAIYEDINFNGTEHVDKRKEFGRELFLNKDSKGKNPEGKTNYNDIQGRDALDAQIDRVIKGVDLYNTLMPQDFTAGYFSSGKRLSVNEAVLILDMARNSERYSRATDTKSIVTYQDAIDLGLAKDVKVLVDLDKNGPIAESTANLTTKENYIYVSEGRPINDKNFKSKYEGKYQKVTKKPILVDMYEVDVYRQPFSNNVKLTTLNAGTFGKVELTGKVETDPKFKDYDYIIGLSTFKKANESFNPETFEVEYNEGKKNKSEKIVEINGKKYLEITMKVGINENVAGWPQEVKDISIDPITIMHSFGTVESLPLFGGAFATINEKGDIEWDASSIANVAIAKEKNRKSTFRPNNFLSTYNQLRAIKVLKFGLENIELTAENEPFINEMKDALVKFKEPNKNFGSEHSFAYVTDIIKTINDKTNNGFLNYLNNKASEVNKRLFSKTLWDMAFYNTTTAYDFDKVKEKYADTYNSFNGHVFYSKGGAEGIGQRFFDNAQVPTHLSGKTVDTFSGDTDYSRLYMNQLDALNYLISNAKPGERSSEYISKNDVIALAKSGMSSLARFDESSMATGYLPNVYVSGIKARDSQKEIKAKDRGVKSGTEGESGEKMNVLMTTWGVLPDTDKDYNYYPGTIQTDDKGKPISNFRKMMNKFKIEDGKIVQRDDSSSVNRAVRSPKFIKQMRTFMDENLGTNDKILRFKNLEPESVVAHINPSHTEMEDGVMTSKYFTDQAVKVDTFAEVENAIKNKFKTTMSGQMYGEKEKIAEASNLFNQEEVGFVESARNKKVEISSEELIEFNAKLNKNKLETETADAVIAGMNGDNERLLSMARERRNYFKGVTEGNIEEIAFKIDLLDTEGMNPKGIPGIQMKQGIQNFVINAKRYQMELTEGLEMIKRMIGTDSYRLDEFNKFTQVRLIQLAYQEARLKSNEYSMNLAKAKMAEMGFASVNEINNFLSTYNKANPGLTNVYFKTINALKDAAMEAAIITGAKETPDELFLLSPLKKKVDTNNTNKNKYYSTLDTLFLDKRSSIDSVIERATDLNFGLSTWILAGNIAKIKALDDAKKMFVKSGAIENKAIYDVVNRDFRSRLSDVGESENKMTRLEKEELLSVLKSKHPDLVLSKTLTESPTFLADVYDEIESYIFRHNGDGSLKKMTLYELDERLKVSKDQVEINNINALIDAKKMQRDFMSDVITLIPSMAKNIYEEIQAVANTKGAVLTNEFMQILPEDGKSTFSFLAGYDLKTIKRNVEYRFSGDTKEQRIAYMALTGNLFMTHAKLANHLDKYYFTDKIPTKVEKILSQAKGTFTNFVMSVPHKLINRMTQYSIGDLSLISVVDPAVVTKLPTAMNELATFYSSKGAALERSPKLKLFLETIGFNPMAYQHGSLNFETMDYDSPAKLGQAYFDAVEKVFTAQTLTFRYALWSSLYDRFEAYDADPSKDKRLYGSLNYMKDQIDAMESSEVKAREIMNAAIGGPNGFALIARKELKNWGMFMTYPLALMRAGVGHLKSMAGAFNEIIQGTANNATKRYVVNTGLGIGATQVMISAFAALIASIYGVDEETEEDWKKRGTYIDPFLTLINDRPIPISMGTTGLTKQLREMFYEPFEEAEGNLINGGWNWLTANVLSKINPLVKVPVELITGKEFYGNAGPKDTTSRNFQENFARKVLSMFIGQSGAIAMTDQWYYTRVGKEDKHFVSKLAESVKEAIKGEMGNYRGYKQESKNYFKALSLLRGFKAIENPSDGYTIYDNNNGFDLQDMSALSKEIKTAMDKEQPPSVIYGIIDEYIKDGASSSTIKSALFNNSISGKISQIKNFDRYYQALSSKEKVILDDAINFESTNYSVVKTMIADYIDGSNNKYKKSIYIPHNYYTYPSSNKYNNYRSYQRSWFDDDKWKKYAKDYMEYRAKENFVPSLTTTTGKYAKDFYDYGIPRIKRVNGKIRTARYQEEGYNGVNHKVYKKGR